MTDLGAESETQGAAGPQTKRARKSNDLREIFESGFLSDCVVKCGDKEWKLHKVILCARSKFFKKALTGSFQVGKTLRFLYSGSLTAEVPDIESFDDIYANGQQIGLTPLPICVSIYKLADYLAFDESLLLEIAEQLHEFVLGMVRNIQYNFEFGGDDFKPDKQFKQLFVASATTAYSVPGVKHILYEFPTRTIRGPFVEFSSSPNLRFLKTKIS
ncbi:hypothetical protein QBC34DRAFT_386678 [Podospora aff. communis PSN243]|uniref:BTB domain-containing protein n=1 Tax=Podospora aff. communis PSN243 TaxID=3040156 RepID=A0AAV9G3L4_9PEZI|nr:hypothetical protein QBC34DRAFT_386678 [Podospora aff. communis PSN243]